MKRTAEKGVHPKQLKITGIFDEKTLDVLLDFYSKVDIGGKRIAAIRDVKRYEIGPKTLTALEDALSRRKSRFEIKTRTLEGFKPLAER